MKVLFDKIAILFEDGHADTDMYLTVSDKTIAYIGKTKPAKPEKKPEPSPEVPSEPSAEDDELPNPAEAASLPNPTQDASLPDPAVIPERQTDEDMEGENI